MLNKHTNCKQIKAVVLVALTFFLNLDPFFWISDGVRLLGGNEMTLFLVYTVIRLLLTLLLILLLPKLLHHSILKWKRVHYKTIVLWIIFFILTYHLVHLLYRLQPTQLGQEVNSGFSDMINEGGAPLYIARVIILTPIFEELIFRASLMSITFKQSKYALDIIFSASLFAISHLLGYSFHWTDFLIYGLMGALLAFIYKTGQSIWYAILAHSLWNLFAIWGLIQYLYVS